MTERKTVFPRFGSRLNLRPINFSKHWKFLSVLLLHGGLLVAAKEASPNVLLLVCDDLRPDMKCYGVPYMITPNMDRLAEEGIIFTRAYVQQAVCTASRASFLTGLRPDSAGVDYPYSQYFVDLVNSSRPTIMRRLMEHGYNVQTFGKVHHDRCYETTDSRKKPDACLEHFSKPHFNAGLSYYALPENRALNEQRHRDKTAPKPPAFECADVPDNAYSDGANTDEAIRAIHNATETSTPFFLAVGYWRPHLPWCAPKKYFDLYDPEKIPLAANKTRPDDTPEYSTVHWNLTAYAEPTDAGGKQIPDDDARKLKRAYSACVSYVDAQIGRLLDELDRTGQRDNTIIILISDHGWHLGEQGCWGKQSNFENATRSPLIVSAPGFKRGEKTDALVEYVDIYPTLCELTGTPVPEYLEGTSFVPLLNNPEQEWKSAVFSQFPREYVEPGLTGRAIRTERYRYVEWASPAGKRAMELYDHQTDPAESVNLAPNPEYRKLLKTLSKQLHDNWQAALPPGIQQHPENPPAPRPPKAMPNWY